MNKFNQQNIRDKLINYQGWLKVNGATGQHTIGRVHYYRNGQIKSVCGQQTLDLSANMSSIIAVGPNELNEKRYCRTCLALKDRQFTSEPEPVIPRLIEKLPPQKRKQYNFVESLVSWVQSNCSKPGCRFVGLYPTSSRNESWKKPHFCPKHNPRILEAA
jgi:hypothetical protein